MGREIANNRAGFRVSAYGKCPLYPLILLQNSIVCGFLMSAYSNSGHFLSRFRLMPMRGFTFRLIVLVFHLVFILSQGLAAVC